MATWQLIENTTTTLVQLLQRHVDRELPNMNVTVQAASTGTFTELGATKKPIITVFLYRIIENAELRNAPRKRLADGTERRQPMVLELCYLITPWGSRPNTQLATDELASLEEHRMMGVALQAFYDHAEIGSSELYEDPDVTKPRVWSKVDSVQLVLESLSIDEMYRIWDASELGYRLSAAYRARVLALDSSAVIGGPPVLDADFKLVKLS